MKKRLLEFLVCPSCQGSLSLRAIRHVADEVTEGELACATCPAPYPIRHGIPRFVASGGYASSFGFQWKRFRAVQMGEDSERELAAKMGFSAVELGGRLVLDAGVGAGRYAEVASRWGAEVVGVDLTDAVDAAYDNIGTRPGVHLVQADIFALPFRAGTFDYAYAIGVLHHTPDPPEAFRRVGRTVRHGGTLGIYVYPAVGVARHFSDAIRKVTTRLPKRLLLYLAWMAVPLYYVYRTPGVGRVCRLVAPISLHPRRDWRWLDTFDWYSPTFQFKYSVFDVYEWFRAAGFHDVRLFEELICMRAVRDGGDARD